MTNFWIALLWPTILSPKPSGWQDTGLGIGWNKQFCPSACFRSVAYTSNCVCIEWSTNLTDWTETYRADFTNAHGQAWRLQITNPDTNGTSMAKAQRLEWPGISKTDLTRLTPTLTRKTAINNSTQ